MRLRTVLVLATLVGVLGVVALAGVGVSAPGGELTEQWVSDTPRENRVNHHAVGIGPESRVVVAPVAEVPYTEVPITDTSCSLVRLRPEDGSTLWQAGLPAEDCFTHALTEPAIEDVDADGSPEVIVSSTENALVAYDSETGTEEWRVPLSTYGYGRPTVATLGSGLSVVTSDIDGGVVATSGNGTVMWRANLSSVGWVNPVVWAAPVVDDVDADGQNEVFVGSNRGVVVLTADGRVDWTRNGSATYVAAADVDEDDARELFTAGTSTVRAYDGASGEIAWERELTNPRLRVVKDGDNDGTVELYVGRVGGEILALDTRTGETEWSTTIAEDGDPMVPPPVLGDVDGDGVDEVLAVTNAGTVAVLDVATGAELAAYERNVPVWTFPAVADLDDDGDDELVVRYGDGRVVALDYTERSSVLPALD